MSPRDRASRPVARATPTAPRPAGACRPAGIIPAMPLADLLLLAHLTATPGMLCIIWFVRVAHHPLFTADHAGLIKWLVSLRRVRQAVVGCYRE